MSDTPHFCLQELSSSHSVSPHKNHTPPLSAPASLQTYPRQEIHPSDHDLIMPPLRHRTIHPIPTSHRLCTRSLLNKYFKSFRPCLPFILYGITSLAVVLALSFWKEEVFTCCVTLSSVSLYLLTII